MRIVAVTHVPFEGPAAIADWASARGHHFEVFRAYDANAAHPGEFEMLVVMGGPMSISDEEEHPWLLPEKRMIAAAIEDGAYVLGVCLGAQLLAEALGAEVSRGKHTEIGWFDVQLDAEASASAVFGRLPAEFEALHWHGDTFAIPAGAVRMARSEATDNQAFEYEDGRIVAIQFHLEETREALATLIGAAGDDLAEGEPWVQSAEVMTRHPHRLARSRQLLYTLLDGMTLDR